ncbi:hypothetical protein L3Q82_021165, partial [Scortum barcoo]
MQCRMWRANPSVPKMADLPPARLRLYKPPFYSTGVDCFGPFTVKVGRQTEKRWGIVFKCLTTRCVHLDLLESLHTDAFLMSLRRFIARRGKPFELLSDNGTSIGGARELREAFETMTPHLKEQLAKQKIEFCFNPPSTPHFGGAWEREVRLFMTLVTPLGIADGGTAKFSSTASGPDLSVTTCLAYRRGRSGRETGSTLNQTKWCSFVDPQLPQGFMACRE